MKKKMLGIIVCTLLIAATCVTVAGTLNYAQDTTAVTSDLGVEDASIKAWYNPAGSWMRSDGAYISTSSLISMENGGRYAQNGEYLASDPSLWWVGNSIPAYYATALSDIHGESVRTGHNTYYGTLLAYAINETYDIVYYVTYSGTSVMTSPDTSYSKDVYVSFYSPDQDPFGEDAPAYGCFGPYSFSYERVQIV